MSKTMLRHYYKLLLEGEVGETYNIGGHNEKKNIEVVEAICDLLEELAPNKPNGVTIIEISLLLLKIDQGMMRAMRLMRAK